MSNPPSSQPEPDADRDRVKKLRDTWTELGEIESSHPGLAGLPPSTVLAASEPSTAAPWNAPEQPRKRLENLSAVIVEQHALFGDVLRNLCEVDLGLTVLQHVRDIGAAAEAVRLTNPYLVLLDGSFTDQKFVTAAETIRRRSPQTRIVFVSGSCDQRSIDESLRLRFEAFVDKNTNSLSNLKEAIVSVTEHQQWFSPAFWRVYSERLQPAQPEVPFTEREREILALMTSAFSEREIADKLQIPVSRINAHRRAIFQLIEKAPIAQIEPFVAVWTKANASGAAQAG